MSRFFIDRPIFAWVIAIIIMLVGLMSIMKLPVSRYPSLALPAVQISATYPGASARTTEDAVTQVIEQNLTGLDGLSYIASTSDNSGATRITLTFASGIDPNIAQVQVQNSLQQAIPLLPQIVQQQGITVSKPTGAYQMVIGFVSEDGAMSAGDISDYLATNVIDSLRRVPGVGVVELFGSKYAMRIWLDANRLNAYALTPADVTAAVKAQNAEISVGQLGDLPAVPGQQLNAIVTALGRLSTPAQFRQIVLRSNSDGSTLQLGDVARVELGQVDYNFSARYNGKPASGLGVTVAPDANALETAQRVEALLDRLRPRLPSGLSAVLPYDTSPFVRKAVAQVLITFGEAVLLVFLVMFLFLQNLRATLIPTIAVPVVLLGTFAVLGAFGFSVNMLTLFAVVLAIGLLVDDAIVVVENVERLMSEEGLSPREATHRSMRQITGALLGIATALSTVFIPMAFFEGTTGIIYRQFSVTIVSAMVLSVVVAIVLTPALCATLLEPLRKGEQRVRHPLFLRFNSWFERASRGYERLVTHIIGRPARYLLLYSGLVAFMGVLFFRLPTAFLPEEDEGYLFTLVQGPVGATQARTLRALDQVGNHFMEQEKDAIVSTFQIAGFNFGGGGQNSGFGFVVLKDWDERTDKRFGIPAIVARAGEALAQIKDAEAYVLAPPPDVDLGNVSGFDFYLKDDHGQGHAALTAARDKFLALAADSRQLTNVRANGQEDAPQFHLNIDPEKAASFDLSMDEVNETLAIAWAGRYVGDFIDRGRVKRVIVQADAPFRMVPEDFARWHVRNARGEMVSVSSFATTRWEFASPRLERYNGISAMQINGQAAPGVSSGDAMKEIERLGEQLPEGFAVDFTGQSYEEREAGAQTPVLYSISLIIVFLCLAALYESWSIPTAIVLSVPLGIIGAVIATTAFGMQRDIYFQVAMLTTAGLATKNAILIVEFAKQNLERGLSLADATIHAVRDRLRPILMTSLAFGIGVLPLAMASGAGAGAQRSIGIGVFGGMLGGTFLGIVFVPLFFVAVQRLFDRRRQPATSAAVSTAPHAS